MNFILEVIARDKAGEVKRFGFAGTYSTVETLHSCEVVECQRAATVMRGQNLEVLFATRFGMGEDGQVAGKCVGDELRRMIESERGRPYVRLSSERPTPEILPHEEEHAAKVAQLPEWKDHPLYQRFQVA